MLNSLDHFKFEEIVVFVHVVPLQVDRDGGWIFGVNIFGNKRTFVIVGNYSTSVFFVWIACVKRRNVIVNLRFVSLRGPIVVHAFWGPPFLQPRGAHIETSWLPDFSSLSIGIVEVI